MYLFPSLHSVRYVCGLNQPRWEYLHHGNQHPLQTRAASLGELAVKTLTSTPLTSIYSGITFPGSISLVIEMEKIIFVIYHTGC